MAAADAALAAPLKPVGPRRADLLVLVNLGLLFVFSLFGNLLVSRPDSDKWAAPYLIWVASMGAAPVLQVFISLPRFAELRARRGSWLFALDLLVCYGPVLSPLRLQANGGFPLASTLILYRGRLRALLIAVQLTAMTCIDVYFWPDHRLGKPHGEVLYWVFDGLAVCIEVYGMTRSAQVFTMLRDTRFEMARTALSIERVRAGRDVHDLLGFSLTAIILKLEIASRSLKRGRDASAGIAEAAQLADRAIVDVRTIAAGEPLISLAAEAVSAEALLRGADVQTEFSLTGDPVPPQADAALALVLREAVTNMIRHSDVRQCAITSSIAGGIYRLEVTNDGLAVGADEPNGTRHAVPAGTGLVSLRARIGALGGQLSARRAGNQFTIVANLPLRTRRTGIPSAETLWLAGIFGTLFLIDVGELLLWGGASPYLSLASACFNAAALGLMFQICRPRRDSAPPRWRWAAVVALILISFPPRLTGLDLFTHLVPLGAALLFLPGGRLARLLALGCGVLEGAFDSGMLPGGHAAVSSLLLSVAGECYFVLLYYLLFQFAWLTRDLRLARAELAQIEIARERARFGRDLRDRVGSGLHSIARLLQRAGEQAQRPGEGPASMLADALLLARALSDDIRAIQAARSSR